jgi:hypothetical protein
VNQAGTGDSLAIEGASEPHRRFGERGANWRSPRMTVGAVTAAERRSPPPTGKKIEAVGLKAVPSLVIRRTSLSMQSPCAALWTPTRTNSP